MKSDALTADAYVAGLPEGRRALVTALRDVVNANLPDGVREGMAYGMIGWGVPHEVYPHGYHCDPSRPVPYASLANQKGGVSLYLFCVYVDDEVTARFQERYAATGKKLDMGKGCVRFKKLDDVPLDLIGQTIREMPVDQFLARYDAGLPASVKKKRGR